MVESAGDTSGDAFEERLRAAFSAARPRHLPTVGIRERIVAEAQRRRRHRRNVVGGSLTALVVVVAGVSFALSVPGRSHAPATAASNRSSSTTPVHPNVSRGHRGVAPTSTAKGVAGPTTSAVVLLDGVAQGCYGQSGAVAPIGTNTATAIGATGTSSGQPAENAPYGYEGPPTPGAFVHSSPQGLDDVLRLAPASTGPAGMIVVVPVGVPVTLSLTAEPDAEWTVPVVLPGQGSDAAAVHLVSSSVTTPRPSARAGTKSAQSAISTAVLQAARPVTAIVEAEQLATCGSSGALCGGTETRWWVVVVFQST